jgi:hypothetical protein
MKLLYFFLGPDTLDNKILLFVLIMELGTIGLTAAEIIHPGYLIPSGIGGFLMLMAKTISPIIAKWATSRMPMETEDTVTWRKT